MQTRFSPKCSFSQVKNKNKCGSENISNEIRSYITLETNLHHQSHIYLSPKTATPKRNGRYCKMIYIFDPTQDYS